MLVSFIYLVSVYPLKYTPLPGLEKEWWSVGFVLLVFVEANAFSQPYEYNCAIALGDRLYV